VKILFVSPCSDKDVAQRTYLSPPLGVVRLAGYLAAKGHAAEYYDPNLFQITETGPTFDDVLTKEPWDIIGFSVLEETLLNDIMGMYHAKKVCPSARIIAGGIEAQFNYQTILDKSPCEIVIIGEGEIPVLMLANEDTLEKIPGIVFKNNAKPLSQELFNEATSTISWETLPYEEYWDYYLGVYSDSPPPLVSEAIHTVRVFSRNRCPIGCKYCSSTNQLTWGSDAKVPVLSATEDNLISVVDRIVGAHPRVQTIYFTDDDFCINKRSVIRFCEKVVQNRGYGDLTFLCFARITDLTEEMVSWMARANFRQLNIGVESFSQTVLEEIGKICDADRIHKGLALLKRYGVKPYFNIILITPESTLDQIEYTVDNAIHYVMDSYFNAGIITAIMPLKGTAFAEEYSDYLTDLEAIPGTPYTIKKDHMIWAKDPITRQLQEHYNDGIGTEVEQRTLEDGIVHKSAQNVSLIKLRFMKTLIKEIREEHGLKSLPAVAEPEAISASVGESLAKSEPIAAAPSAEATENNADAPDAGFGHL
jgi:radical SAM superfamily enzyme YgiQ (UPF0313 family)